MKGLAKTTHVPRRRLKDILSRYTCVECDARPPRGDYMVHDAVWAKAGMPRRGFLCLSCLEKRLIVAGHGPLCLDDFIEAPCNAGIRFGYAMARGGDQDPAVFCYSCGHRAGSHDKNCPKPGKRSMTRMPA